MIPLELSVRNFMCYRDDVPPLRFDGIHLACLTGANGHGKSALLDAMTWALWGKARAKRDDELIHLGEAEMEVEFRFDLAGAEYRVLRKRDSTKRGRTILDLQVKEPGEGGAFRSMAEPGVRATQDAITRLLRMDYETFTNSAFLVQGKADAFTTRTPAERKRVLGEILGLGQYDEYEQRAKEKAAEKGRQVADLEALLRDVDRELAHRPAYEEERTRAEARVAEISTATQGAEAALRELRHEQQKLEHQQARLRDLEKRLSQAERELVEIENQALTRQQRLDSYESVLAKQTRVEEGYAALLKAREIEENWNARLAKYVQIQEQQRQLERAVDAARHELDLELGRLTERVRDLQRRAQDLPAHESQLAAARATLAQLAQRQSEREAAQTQLQALSEELAGSKVRNDQLRAEMEVVKEKMGLLEQAGGEAACPLCRQVLSDQHRGQVIAQFKAEGTALGDAYRANKARQKEISAKAGSLQEEIRQLDRDLAGQPAQQRREAQLDRVLVDAQEAAAELETRHAERKQVEERLGAGDYAPEEQQELAHLATELEVLASDRDAHQRAQAETSALAEFELANQQLQTALRQVDEERAALKELQARQTRWQEASAEDQSRRDSLAAEVLRLPQVEDEVRAAAEEVEDLRAQSSKARLLLGAAQQKLDHCQYLALSLIHI